MFSHDLVAIVASYIRVDPDPHFPAPAGATFRVYEDLTGVYGTVRVVEGSRPFCEEI